MLVVFESALSTNTSIDLHQEIMRLSSEAAFRRTAEFVRALVAAMSLERDEAGAYEVYGSVEGPAEALDVRGEPYFTVRDAIGGGAVRCYFGDSEREEVALAVSGKRIVSVGGILHRDQAGRPQRISPVRSFAVIDEPLPGEWVSPAGLFAGIGDTQEYLRSIRGE